MSNFQALIAQFNKMYNLPVATEPSLEQLGVEVFERLESFADILDEECGEIGEVQEALLCMRATLPFKPAKGEPFIPDEADVLTMLADLLGDIIVYCASEMAKFGIPQDAVLSIIMDSNRSKMGASGLPIYDERGKLMKGPNYWKPEPEIRKLLLAIIAEKRESERLIQAEAARFENALFGAFDPLPIDTQQKD